ncbi:hypothetical protein [Sphingomonas aerolata]|uniref:hypothetical protein n=1 Tax=Sphingomonas aerolata TaxID=185951 RepID=UPI002FDFEDEF
MQDQTAARFANRRAGNEGRGRCAEQQHHRGAGTGAGGPPLEPVLPLPPPFEPCQPPFELQPPLLLQPALLDP